METKSWMEFINADPEEILAEFQGRTEEDILKQLNYMWPYETEDNEELAKNIIEWLETL